MKLAIILTSKDYEKAWNAFRFANAAKNQKHEVKMFLLGEAVECEGLTHHKFNVDEELQKFLSTGGKLFVNGTSLNMRHYDSSDVGLVATMTGCVDLVNWSDRVLTF